MSLILRDYQTAAINKLRSALGRNKRVMLYSPTGSGKTEIAMEVIRCAKEKGSKVAFVCNRVGLVSQGSRRFNQSHLYHGILQSDNTKYVNSDVMICSIQTIASRGFPENIKLIVIDEAHGCTSEQYRKLIEKCKDIPVIGLSATPFQKGLGRDYGFGPLFGEMVIATTIKELIDTGYLVDCDIYAPSEPDLRGVKINRFGDYDEIQLGVAVDKPKLVGDIIEHWQKLANGMQSVVFATNIAHSKHIVEEFIAAGITAEHIDCYTTDEDRIEILKRHQDGITTVVSNVNVLAEGWDSPITSCMILARPTRSLKVYIQMVGRALRPYEGKIKALVLDHSGTCYRLGFPTDDLPMELDDGKKAEVKDAENKPSLPHVCPNCHYLIQAGVGVCPHCGMVPVRPNKIEHEAGTLEKVERKEKFTNEQKQELWSSCLGLAEKRKRSEGWASHLYRSMAGVWPRGLKDIPCEPIDKVVKMAQHNAIAWAHSKRNATNIGAAA